MTLSGSSRYPGALVAIPTLGAGLIIAAGAAEPSVGSRALATAQDVPVSGCHLVPALSLALADPPVGRGTPQRDKPARVGQRGAFARGGVLATLTYYFFENPIRHNKALATRRWASLVLGVFLIASTSPSRPWQSISTRRPLSQTDITNLKTGDACPSPTKQTVESLMGTGHQASPKTVARVR